MHPSMRMRLRAAGQATVEFAVAFPAILLLVFGVIQLALLYQGRATLNYATMQAARAGALHHGDAGAMRNALARGLAPLFAAEASPEGYAEALAKAMLETTVARVEVLNPTSAAMDDFGRARLDGQAGRELPDDTLSYRSTTPGAASGIPVQDANLLHLRVTYCFRLIVPVVDRMLRMALGGTAGAPGNAMSNPFGTAGATPATDCAGAGLSGIRIPVRSEAVVRMQSSFYASNLPGAPGGGSTVPPDTGSPGTPGTPGNPGNPGGPDPTDPGNPGEPECF